MAMAVWEPRAIREAKVPATWPGMRRIFVALARASHQLPKPKLDKHTFELGMLRNGLHRTGSKSAIQSLPTIRRQRLAWKSSLAVLSGQELRGWPDRQLQPPQRPGAGPEANTVSARPGRPHRIHRVAHPHVFSSQGAKVQLKPTQSKLGMPVMLPQDGHFRTSPTPSLPRQWHGRKTPFMPFLSSHLVRCLSARAGSLTGTFSQQSAGTLRATPPRHVLHGHPLSCSRNTGTDKLSVITVTFERPPCCGLG